MDVIHQYFYNFPAPKITKHYAGILPEKFALLHLASNNLANAHRTETFYVKGLVQKIAKDLPCVILSTPSTREYLQFAENMPNVQIIETDLEKVVDIINRCSVMLAIDSGLSYFGFACGKPTYVMSAQAYDLGKVQLSHKCRWLIYEHNCIPLYYDNTKISNLVKNTVENPALWLCPQVQDFDRECVVRHYTVNLEKSILNEASKT